MERVDRVAVALLNEMRPAVFEGEIASSANHCVVALRSGHIKEYLQIIRCASSCSD
jgi:hypothetical protein